jgi:hypothetical protein
MFQPQAMVETRRMGIAQNRILCLDQLAGMSSWSHDHFWSYLELVQGRKTTAESELGAAGVTLNHRMR